MGHLGIAASASSCDIDLDWLCSGPNTLYIVAPLIDHDRSAGVLGGSSATSSAK
jgi:hypothetical protein